MSEIILTAKDEFMAKFSEILNTVPPDTKSIQCVIYAFSDDFDSYNDGTKCLTEEEIWLNISPEERVNMLEASCSELIENIEDLQAAASETFSSEDEKQIFEEMQESALRDIRMKSKILARCFMEALNNIDFADKAQKQLSSLFEKLLKVSNREIFFMIFNIFQKKMPEYMTELQWSLMANKRNVTVGKPITTQPQQNESAV